MIVAIALCDFSQEMMNQSQQATQENKSQKTEDQMKVQNEDQPKIKEDSDNNMQQQSIKLDEIQAKDQNISQKDKEKNEQDNQNGVDQNKQAQKDTPDQNLQEVKGDDQQKDTDQQSQIAQQDQTKPKQNETQQQDNQTQQMQYLSFKKYDRIVVKYQHPNGWWWGCQLGIRDPKDGYFPSSYVKFSHKIGDDLDENEKQVDEQEIENMGWNEYAQYVKKNAFDQEVDQQYEKFINESVDKKEQDLQKYLNPGIKGYKKVKIDPSQQNSYKNIQGSYFSQEGDAVYIPIKSQDPLDRAYRQLNHYFNYDSWNDQMNQQRQCKSKPNPNKKKEKNENKFLQKIK